MNLLAVNARDAMPHGGKLTIEVADVTCDEEYARSNPSLTTGEYVMLAISDTGVGMDAATQLHIFEPFFTTKGLKGTGLGLSTVYGIIQQSRGYIQVSSQPGKGTSFKIYLPRVGATGQAIPREPTITTAKPEQALETILLVEDENSLRNLSRQFLESQGYPVLEAAERAAAIQICNSHPGPIHLLLTDLTMPGINGRELARRVKCHAAEDERALYVRLYRECQRTQCHIGGGDCPASKALFTLYSENQGEREALLRFPCATFQFSVASEIPAAGRKRLAQWHYRKHQPFGNVVPGGGNDSTQRPARD